MLLNSFQMQRVSSSDHENAFELKNHKHFLIGKISKLATHYSCARFRNSLSLWLFRNHFTLICDMRIANHLEQSPKSTWISFSFLFFCFQLLLLNFVCSIIFFSLHFQDITCVFQSIELKLWGWIWFLFIFPYRFLIWH